MIPLAYLTFLDLPKDVLAMIWGIVVTWVKEWNHFAEIKWFVPVYCWGLAVVAFNLVWPYITVYIRIYIWK